MKKLQTALAVMSLGGVMAAAPASAITITNTDLTNENWNSIDWASGGTAFTQGFAPVAGTVFNITYFAWAVTLGLDSDTLFTPSLDNNANGLPPPNPPITQPYEYTVVSTLSETVTGCVGTTCTFYINSGNFTVYYDTTPNANTHAGSFGTGFTDGDDLYSGYITGQNGGQFDLAGAINSFTVQTHINYTNPLYIHPALNGGTTSGTLQLAGGAAQTGYINPGGFNGTPWGSLQNPGVDVVFQADGNTIVRVPEPGTLMLLGAAMLGFAVVRRKSA